MINRTPDSVDALPTNYKKARRLYWMDASYTLREDHRSEDHKPRTTFEQRRMCQISREKVLAEVLSLQDLHETGTFELLKKQAAKVGF